MRTPAGKDCRFYYQDFHRQREVQECRLVKENPASMNWQPSDCAKCQVPDILGANSSKFLELELTIKSQLFGFVRKVDVKASCMKHKVEIADPFVGCEKCNAERPGLEMFIKALEQPDSGDSGTPT
jgi:hypothetical protein